MTAPQVLAVRIRAAPDQVLYAELTTVAEGFAAVGSEADLRAETEHSDQEWARARATGSRHPAHGAIV